MTAGGSGPPGWSAPARRRPGRGRRTLWRIAVVVAAGVFVGGVTTAAVTYLHLGSPASAVTGYFAALRSGDAPEALRYGREQSGDLRYLTSSVLRVQQGLAPINGVSVTSARQDGDSATVVVIYTIGVAESARPVKETLTLHKVDRRWLMDSTAASVRIDVGNGRNRATMGGLDLPTAEVELFPGRAPVTYDTDLLEQLPSSDSITLASTGVLRVVAGLTESGRKVLTDSVTAAMTTCLAQAAQAPASCPLTPGADRVVPGSLRGKVTVLTLSADPSLVSGNADGLVQVNGTFAVPGTWSTLDFDNLPVGQSGTAKVPVSARAYVTAPQTVSWMRP